MTQAEGFGVLTKDSDLDARNVSPTPLGTMVNYLVTKGYTVYNGVPEADIKATFLDVSRENGDHLVSVQIKTDGRRVDISQVH